MIDSADGPTIVVEASLWVWSEGKGSWHFVTVPAGQTADIRLRGLAARRGFGSVPVEARIGEIAWRTSLFPVRRTGEYLLPVKTDVRRRTDLTAGDDVTVTLKLI